VFGNELVVMGQLQQFYDDYVAQNYKSAGNDMAQVLKGFGSWWSNSTTQQYGVAYSLVNGMSGGALMPYTPGLIGCVGNASLTVNNAWISFYQGWATAVVKASEGSAKNASETFLANDGPQIYQQFESLMTCFNETSDNSDLVAAYGMGYDPYDNTFQSKLYLNQTVWTTFCKSILKLDVPYAVGLAVGDLFYEEFEDVNVNFEDIIY